MYSVSLWHTVPGTPSEDLITLGPFEIQCPRGTVLPETAGEDIRTSEPLRLNVLAAQCPFDTG